MAKGNDGNYFQHSIEVTVAMRLAAMDLQHSLFIALAHGMAPFEPCDDPRPGQSRALLLRALNDSYHTRRVGEAPLVSAYRGTRANLGHYLNSAELLRYVIGADQLSGGITEVEPAKYEQLTRAWRGSRIAVANTSWRAQLHAPGVLVCPEGLASPWLFSLDPMTYKLTEYTDDWNVYRADIDRLSSAVQQFVFTGQPSRGPLRVRRQATRSPSLLELC